MAPGRRTNRKNFRTCQRTRLFLLLLFLESNEKTRFYPLRNQPSAARSQACVRFWCNRFCGIFGGLCTCRFFRLLTLSWDGKLQANNDFLGVEMSKTASNHAVGKNYEQAPCLENGKILNRRERREQPQSTQRPSDFAMPT